MNIIDCHTHIFHDKIALSTVSELAKISGIVPITNGTKAETLQYMQENNVSKIFALNIATTAKNNFKVNDFAIEINCESIVAFGSINPKLEDYKAELIRLKAFNIKGIKFHPQYQGFDIDDKSMFNLYSTIVDMGFLVSFHMGFDPLVPECQSANPKRLKVLADMFGGKNFIATHFGGEKMWDEALTHLAKSGVYFDTAICFNSAEGDGNYKIENNDIFKKIIDGCGVEKVLFATDTPWGNFNKTLEFVNGLGLSKAENEKVLFANAQNLLNK